jgi:hypothetical protein
MTFAADLQQFSAKATSNNNELVRAVTTKLFNSIVLSSPVDTGRFRGNWQVSYDAPIMSEIDRLDPSGAEAVAQIASVLQPKAARTYLTNNLPYAEVIEFGGYPDPVLRGTWVKGKGYVIKSIGGYSKQAPVGMVRVNMTRIAALLKA